MMSKRNGFSVVLWRVLPTMRQWGFAE
ncbi:Protein of unknown function [Pyronema omphalodes CBS 100304]|uniref:Uncharacterized protein n=1 Tax=Pyronema omphalodes (strain CBS 100304) TaxID=1076935 RepID=U4LI67_PYROM|nr:Protein of unknown function [Pyronema omphalodes CBS 100304]